MQFFSVTWRIENFSMCMHKVGEGLISPIMFTLPQLSNIKWNLQLYPLYPRGDRITSEGDYVSFYVIRNAQSSEETKFIGSSIIVNTDDNYSKKLNGTFTFNENGGKGFFKFISCEELYKDAKGFLPNDILTVQFHLFPIFDEQNTPNLPAIENIFSSNPSNINFTVEECLSKDDGVADVFLNHCSFLTRMPVERRIINWSIKDFDAKRKSKERMSVTLDSEFHEGVKLLLVCYIVGSSEDDESLKLEIKRKGIGLRRAFLKCDVSFLNSSGVIQCTKKSEHVFSESYQSWSFSLIDKLSSSKDLLQNDNDSLNMKCEFRISYDPQNVKHLTKTESAPQSDLQKEIKKMLEYEDTFDVNLECKREKKFPVHKFLLCAKSPVFRAMFSSDTLEKQTGVIRMLDIDTTTVQRLRDYLYSDSLPDIKETEDILKLYPVADKYNIEKLKNKCAAFLKINITADNVCNIITLADMHHDAGLKDYANDFMIAEMDFDSEIWKRFTKENATLAAETMRNCLVKTKKASKN